MLQLTESQRSYMFATPPSGVELPWDVVRAENRAPMASSATDRQLIVLSGVVNYLAELMLHPCQRACAIVHCERDKMLPQLCVT